MITAKKKPGQNGMLIQLCLKSNFNSILLASDKKILIYVYSITYITTDVFWGEKKASVQMEQEAERYETQLLRNSHLLNSTI